MNTKIDINGSYVDRFFAKLEEQKRGIEWLSPRDIAAEFFEFLKSQDVIREHKEIEKVKKKKNLNKLVVD